jgi:hypothetical protein
MEKPPEIKLELGFHIETAMRQRLVHLWHQCLITRDRGIEYRMDHGRALGDMREFLMQYDEAQREHGFRVVCDHLETTVDEANRRINMARTWDEIREYIEERGLSTPMPQSEWHLICLFGVQLPKRGEAWVRIYQDAIDNKAPVTGRRIQDWMDSAKALPVPSETVASDAEPASGSGGKCSAWSIGGDRTRRSVQTST